MKAKTITNGYELHEVVGKGAGSIIYRAVELKTGAEVAIKQVSRDTIHKRMADTGDYKPYRDHTQINYNSFYNQLKLEYEICKQLEKTPISKYVPKVFKLLAHRKFFILTSGYDLVMEYIAGDTLRKNRDYPIKTLIQFYHDIAKVLYGIHSQGLLHSDLKPQHIVVTPEGQLKLLDYGQCRKPQDTQARLQGTPDYMSPEQLKGRMVDVRTDIYSLGATFYWILTGKNNRPAMAMAGPGMAAGFTVGFSGRSRSIREENPEVPEPLERLILDSCNPRINERPSSMRVVLERLEQLLSKIG